MTNKTRIHKVPTILDAFKLSIYLNPKIHQNNCPKNKYIPNIKTYYTICDNGSRKIPKYYLNGVLINEIVNANYGGVSLESGFIAFQAEYSEITYRKIKIKEL